MNEYRVSKRYRMPYLYRSLSVSANKTYNYWFIAESDLQLCPLPAVGPLAPCQRSDRLISSIHFNSWVEV